MTEIGYDAGDRGEPEYPEQHECEWKLDVYRSRAGHMKVRIGCKRKCPLGLDIQEAESMLNEYPTLLVELNEFAIKIIDLKNEIVTEQLKSIRLKKATETLTADDARRISNRKLPVSEHEELQAYANILEGKV